MYDRKIYKILKNRFLLASSKKPKAIVNFDTFTDDWINEKQKYLRNKLRDCKLVNYGNYYLLKDLLLPYFNENYNSEFYDIVQI